MWLSAQKRTGIPAEDITNFYQNCWMDIVVSFLWLLHYQPERIYIPYCHCRDGFTLVLKVLRKVVLFRKGGIMFNKDPVT